MNFSKVIFWDVDYNKIDWKNKSRFVISRIVRYGTAEDWQKAKEFYGLEQIKIDMIEERDLDERSLSFLSCVLEVPKEIFKCYSQKPLRQAHSPF